MSRTCAKYLNKSCNNNGSWNIGIYGRCVSVITLWSV